MTINCWVLIKLQSWFREADLRKVRVGIHLQGDVEEQVSHHDTFS